VHSVLNATPAQIVFGRDMLFDLSFTTEYKEIKKRKQEASDANTHKENKQVSICVRWKHLIIHEFTNSYLPHKTRVSSMSEISNEE
jgi:hypothetical protein